MKRLVLGGALSMALLLGACSTTETDTDEPTVDPVATTSAEPTMAPSEPETTTPDSTPTESDAAEQDIVDTAVAAGDFTTLAEAVTAAELVETLKGPGPFTVFAPTDEAFAALPDGTLEQLLEDPTGDLAEILKYHVVAGEVFAEDVVALDGQQVETVQGAQLTVEVDGDQVVLVDAAGNRINVVATDVEASNGVIHVIDGVLMPTA